MALSVLQTKDFLEHYSFWELAKAYYGEKLNCPADDIEFIMGNNQIIIRPRYGGTRPSVSFKTLYEEVTTQLKKDGKNS